MGLFLWLQGDVIFKAKRRSRTLGGVAASTTTYARGYLPSSHYFVSSYLPIGIINLLGHPIIIFLNFFLYVWAVFIAQIARIAQKYN